MILCHLGAPQVGSEALVVFWMGLETSKDAFVSPGLPGVLQRSPMGILSTTSHSNAFSLWDRPPKNVCCH